MTSADEDFPRGGTFTNTNKLKGTKRPFEQDNLFEPYESNEKKKKKDNSYENKKIAQKEKEVGASKLNDSKNVDILYFKNLVEGMLIMGCIKEVGDFELMVSLPCGLNGFVSVTNISDSYTKFLTDHVNTDEIMEEVLTLSHLFSPGMILRCIISTLGKTADGHNSIKLSINPKDVNKGLSSGCLTPGMVLSGSVASIEDHGFLIDIGIPGSKAFLPKQKAFEYLKEIGKGNLKVGQYLNCLIEEVKNEGRIVRLSISQSAISKVVALEKQGWTLSSLLPGLVVNAEIDKVSQNGLTVKFFSSFTGTVDFLHLDSETAGYNNGQQVKACILYIQPTSRAIGMSLRPYVLKPGPTIEPVTSERIGEVFKDCTIKKLYRHSGASIVLPDKTVVFAHRHHLMEFGGQLKPNKVMPGTKHTCRILDYAPMDQMFLVSLQRKIITASFLRYKDIKPGEIIEGKISSLQDYGMWVSITPYIRGLVPRTHLADIILKNPSKKYSPGDEVRCRVLDVNPVIKRMILTLKKTLVKSTFPIIVNYENAEPGMITHGVIVCIKDFGCIVCFYNNVKGLVPRNELSTEVVPNPEKMFYTGQVVKVKVLKCNPEEKKLLLSFKAVSSGVSTNKMDVMKQTQTEEFDCNVGKIVEVEVLNKTENGLNVTILPQKIPAFLPLAHLSDHVTNCTILWEVLQVGDIISNVMCFNKSSQQIMLTKKTLIKNSVEENDLPKDISDLHSGMLLIGFVRNIKPYGVFVEFPFGLIGLAPKSALSDKYVTDTSDFFQTGQTVVAKVTEIDVEKRRFLVNLQISQCTGEDDQNESLKLLLQCLKERNSAVDILNKRGDPTLDSILLLSVSKKIEVVFEEESSDGTAYFKCSKVPGAIVKAVKYHMKGVNVVPGQKVKPVVLHVDLLTSQVHVSLRKELLNCPVKELMLDSKHLATVQHVEKDFAIVSLEESGQLAAMPVTAHLNDCFRFQSESLTLGQTLNVSLKHLSKKSTGGLVLVLREPDKFKNTTRVRKTSITKEVLPTGPKHSLNLGDIVVGTVKSIKPTSVLVTLENGITCRIHASEIPENATPGSFPSSLLKVGQKVTARVIGGRDCVTNRHLPITHPHFTFTMPELTVLPSKINSELKPEDIPLIDDVKTFEVGTEVVCFVIKYNSYSRCLHVEITGKVWGTAELLLMSLSPKDLKHPEKLFKLGQAIKATVVTSISADGRLSVSINGVKNLAEDTVTLATVSTINPNVGLILSLPFSKTGYVGLTDISDSYMSDPLKQFSLGQIVRCCVLGEENKKIRLSMRPSKVFPGHRPKIRDAEILSVANLNEGQIVRGFIKSISDKGIFVSLSRTVTGRIKFKYSTCYFLKDHTDYAKNIPLGMLVSAMVLEVDVKENKVELSILQKDTGEPDIFPPSLGFPLRGLVKDKEKSEAFKKRKRKLEKEISDTKQTEQKKKGQHLSEENYSGVEVFFREPIDDDDDERKENLSHTSKTLKEIGEPRLQVSGGFSWDVTLDTLQTFKMVQVEYSSEGEEETDNKPQKKTKRQMNQDKQLQEMELAKVERELMDPNRQPKSANDFDRLVLSSPDSSIVWLQYMAFHLHATEIDQARVVAERALKTISFREEQEKMNVWVALLNLENLYGTEESLNKVFERAVQYCEPLKVFQHLADIYTKSEKYEKAEMLYNTMLKRFRQEKSVWLKYAMFLFKQGQTNAAQRLLQRALKCLLNKDHIDTIVKFAQLEFRYGDTERAKSVFESTLSNYPKRSDLWSVYIDMMIKHGSQEEVRAICERVIHMSLPAKKIKFFFKRYLEYEKKHGTAESVEGVKQKAMDYIEGKSAVS
ncbi:LOW QUALITY PROTEIN: protein RRP5 homolog [Erpetoichthys calabaricus]|uniref:LOW QUALITY PROTEIN: protein RRP5 homolog n=1 Tax=Erpetoichthys calabaricus TaxID=27687 RepID=UPI002234E6D4|nr:LOW QUALITY PROTEIN: protein RRP5 homolog [Erpetoichthys calabaricus]